MLCSGILTDDIIISINNEFAEVKEWYDGYRFGNTEVYCLWEVIRYCKTLCADPNAIPEDYWSNTSLTQRGCAGE